ncbi:MAG: S8 family serine peptidase [Actinomycetes bacterium]
MKSKRVQAVVLTTAVVAGYTGAAAYSAWAQPALREATDFGPGDGLTRLVLTAESGVFDQASLAALESVDGVVTAQPLQPGSALVATEGLAPHHLEAVPGIADAEFSTSVPVLGEITDPYFPQYGWNLENTGANFYDQPGVADADVDATAGWESGTGAGRIVAVVDSGFDSDHPDLRGSLWTNPAESCGSIDRDRNGLAGDCHGWNFYTNSADVDNGTLGSHGAAVSGAVGARANNGTGSAGIAPDVAIMPLVIGGGSTVDVNLGVKAIRYAVDHGADVINASWGGAFSGAPLAALKDAVAYAAAHDVLVVAAAGNDAGDRDTSNLYPASLPDANLVTVGSSNAADARSTSSAYGATSVDLFAPGNRIATTWNDGGYRLVSGTSLAAPQVAAAYALYRAQMREAGFAELKQALLDDVQPIAAFAGRSVTGGRLSLEKLTGTAVETVRYAFTAMTAPAGVVSPAIGVSGPVAAGDYDVVLGLGMENGGEIWALSGKAVTLGGVTVSTDDAGDAVFPLGNRRGLDGVGLSPTMELGDGRYVLTVQAYRDGNPVGSTYAAPLLVGSAVPAPGSPGGSTPGSTPGTSPDGPTPDGTSPDGSTPPDTGSPDPAPGPAPTVPGGIPVPSDPGTTDPGRTPDVDGTDPGTTDPGTRNPGTTNPGTPPTSPSPEPDGGSDGPTPDSGTPEPPADGTAPDGPDGGTVPGTDPVGPPGRSTPDTGSGGTAPSGPVPGTTTYPGVGAFRITSLSPNVVDVAGGTLVTIIGEALPDDPTVRVGATTTGTVVTATSTRVTFRVPARVAGVYDVSVFAPDGRSTVLSNGLTYAGGVGTPDPGTDDGGSTPDSGTAPGGTTPGGAPAPDDGSAGGSTPGTGPVVASGPAGERLVRSAEFDALRSIWSLDCSSSCTGLAI